MAQTSKTKQATAKKTSVSKTATAKKPTTKTATAKRSSKPSFEKIQQKAYEIYLGSGKNKSAHENWMQAEKELSKLK